MCNNAVEGDTWLLTYVPDWLKSQGMWYITVAVDSSAFKVVPDRFKTQDMSQEGCDDYGSCGGCGGCDRLMLRYVPDPKNPRNVR